MSYSKTRTEWQVRLARFAGQRSLKTQRLLGRLLGSLFYWLPNGRKRVAKINLKMCFPTLDRSAHRRLLKANLKSTGQGVMEMMAALWAKDTVVRQAFTISGLEHLQACLAEDEGCLLLSCHTTSIEWGIRGLNAALREARLPVGHMLARQHNNKMLEAHLEEARLSFVEKLIDKKNLRSLLSSVKSGHPVYYAPDQNFSYQVRFSEFFGQPAATTTGTWKLAQKGLRVIPWFCFRVAPTQWHIEVLPEWTTLAGMDEQTAVDAINQLFAEQISRHPEQYLWVHRRFKNQPEGRLSPY
jgi:KDO2-lipid IV(A) lauroyltransferase